MNKIAITTTSFAKTDPRPMEALKKEGLKISVNALGRKLSKDETVDLCRGCVGILAGTESYSKDVLVKLPGLKAISRCGVGTDNIDMQAARELGVAVAITPNGPTMAVAELAVGLMLDLLRKISRMDRNIRAGGWEKMMGNLLSGKTVGVIGFGRIGQKVAQLVKLFGCQVVYSDMAKRDSVNGCERASLEGLLRKSDIVSIHVSSKDTIIGEKEIALMKKGALVLNLSRGETVDEHALIRALEYGRLGGAACDVFNEEPYHGTLAAFDNVVLTPHIGSYAIEARVGMETEAAENLITLLKGAE